MFSGGDYDDVARWLKNFLVSHAKREHPRLEVLFEAGDEREGQSYGARLRFADRVSAPLEFAFAEVRDQRGTLAWCRALAERTRAQARDLVVASTPAGAGAR